MGWNEADALRTPTTFRIAAAAVLDIRERLVVNLAGGGGVVREAALALVGIRIRPQRINPTCSGIQNSGARIQNNPYKVAFEFPGERIIH